MTLAVFVVAQVLLAALVVGLWWDVRRRHRALHATLGRVDAHVQAGTKMLREATEGAESRTERRLESRFATLDHSLAAQRRKTVDHVQIALRKQYQQLEALGALYYGARPQLPIPPTRTWAASPDLLRYLLETVRRDGGIRQVLECGSGVSTLVFAYGLSARGSGRVVALEHDDQYAELTRTLLREHGLEQWAEVRFAPLKPVELSGEGWPWYDVAELPAGPFDLVLVDGPPGATRDQARFPAVPLLYDRVAPGGAFVLDDYEREEEHQVAQRWLELFPDLALSVLRHEKGTAVLRRRPTSTPPIKEKCT